MFKNPLSKFIDYDLQKVKKVKGIDSDIAISWIYIVMLGNGLISLQIRLRYKGC